MEKIVPKIGEDLNRIEEGVIEARQTLTKSLVHIAEELSEHRILINAHTEQLPLYHKNMQEVMRLIKSSNRRLLNAISNLNGGKNYEYDDFFEESDEVDDTPYNPVGGDTEIIMDELSIEDIRGIVRSDKSLFKHIGEEKRSYRDRRSGIDRRRRDISPKGDDRRLFDRRSGKDRREEKTIGHLRKLSQIVDVLQDNPNASVDGLRRRSRINDF